MINKEAWKVFDIKKKDVVSIVGAGGKTSLMFYLADILSGKVIVTCSTKIAIPDLPYSLVVGEQIHWSSDDEVIVTAKEQRSGKLLGYNTYCSQSDYDYLLIEADGSRKLPLKGWGEHEPFILQHTNVTIGVVDITTIGMSVSAKNIFRLDELDKITQLKRVITLENLRDLIEDKNGLFKNSLGRRILFMNKVEGDRAMDHAKILSQMLTKGSIDRIILGSVANQLFESVEWLNE